MAVNKLAIFILLSTIGVQAQENRYMVFFKDKMGTSYSINQPNQFLSQRSIDRRNKQGITVTDQDLPVNTNYINQVTGAGGTALYQSKWFNGLLIEATPSEATTIQGLNCVQSIEYVAPGKIGTGGRLGNSQQKSSDALSGLSNKTQLAMLGVGDMFLDGLTGEGIVIAVLDAGFSGVNNKEPFDHLTTNGKVSDQYNFAYRNTQIYAYDDHGTQVLSTIAGSTTNYQGSAADATFLLYVTEHVPTEYRVEEYFWTFAAERADSVGADIISSSLGYSEFDDASMDYTYDDLDGQHAAISKAAQFAFERGIVVVNSAGNRYPGSNWSRIAPPADGPNVLAVGSVDSNQTHAPSSLLGPNAMNTTKPDVMAMGAGAVVIDASGNVTSSNGTSFSCPQIAAFVACVWQLKPELPAREMIDLIRKASSMYFNPNNTYGYGIPTYPAVKNILEFDAVGTGILIYPNPIQNNELKIAVSDVEGQDVWIRLSTLLGQPVYEQTYQMNWQSNPFTIDASILAPGVYVAQVKAGTLSRTIRIVKP